MTGRSSSGGGSMLPVSCSIPSRAPTTGFCIRMPAASPSRYRMSGAARQVISIQDPTETGWELSYGK